MRQVAVLELSAGLYAVCIWRAINQKKAIVMLYDAALVITINQRYGVLVS